MLHMITETLPLGMLTRTDFQVTSMSKKDKVEIQPGDLLTLVLEEKITKVDKVSNTNTCIYGVATWGITQSSVPVMTRGHIIAPKTTPLANAKPGQRVGQNCNSVIVVKSLKALDSQGKSVDAFEIKI